MMNTRGQKLLEILQLLREEPSSNQKKEILKQNYSDDLCEVFYFAYSNLNFHFKKLSGTPVFASKETETTFDDFFLLAHKLNFRSITGKKAQQAVHDFITSSATQELWEGLFFPILKKDLKCGVTSTLWNSICKSNHRIEKYCPMGAVSTTSEKKLAGKKYVELKYDGVRATIFWNPNLKKANILSRNGKPYKNFKKLESIIEQLDYTHGFLLDGEIVSDDFQTLSKQLQRKENVDCDDAIFHAFDLVYHSASDRLLKHRKDDVKYMIDRINSESFKYVDFEVHHPVLKLNDYYDTLMNQKVQEYGVEGIVIKDPESMYVNKKSDAFIKRKPTITIDLPIVDFQEGELGTKNEGNLGALIVKGTDDGKYFVISCGGGLSDELRKEIWNNKDKYLGKMIEIEGDSITQAENSPHYSLRFPRFVRFRPEKE